MAPFKRRTQEGACLCPGDISYIPGLGFSAHDGLRVFRLIITCALMRATTSNGVTKSKADLYLCYIVVHEQSRFLPSDHQIMKLSETQRCEIMLR